MSSSLSDLEDQPVLEQQKRSFVLLPLSSDLRYLHENKGARAKSDRLLAETKSGIYGESRKTPRR